MDEFGFRVPSVNDGVWLWYLTGEKIFPLD